MMFTNFEEIAERINSTSAILPGKCIRIEVDEGGSLLVDGFRRTVGFDRDTTVDGTLRIPLRELAALVDGQIDARTSFMLGKFQFEGDLSVLFGLDHLFFVARSYPDGISNE